jgi:hypothetical protein
VINGFIELNTIFCQEKITYKMENNSNGPTGQKERKYFGFF